MSLTDPTAERTLLHSVAKADHDALAHVAYELSRATDDTPGVRDMLRTQLVQDLSAHLRVEATVVLPDVRAALGDEVHDQLVTDAQSMVETTEIDDLSRALSTHARLIDETLLALASSLDESRLVTLGYAYLRAAEAVTGT